MSIDNKMSEKDFDQLLRSKMDEQELLHKPSGWDKVFNELHNQNDKNVLPFLPQEPAAPINNFSKKYIWMAACAVAIVGVFCISTLLTDKHQANNYLEVAVEHENNSIPNSPTNISQQPIDQNFTSNNNGVVNQVKVSNTNTATKVHVANSANPIPKGVTSNNDPYLIPFNSDKQTILHQDVVKQEQIQEVFDVQNELPKSKQKSNDLDMRYIAENSAKTNRNLILGVNGGYNFGNMNSGYTVSLKGRADITNVVYVDASVGVNMNNLPYTAASVPISSAKARPSFNDQNAVHLPAVKNPTQQLLYVQFNPSVGYKVTNNINVSVGGDLQQIVQDRKEEDINIIFNPEKNKTGLIPQTDWGLTAKTEVKLGKRLSAGLLYREGINNIISAPPSPELSYINRRYMQVQLTYNITGKL